VGGIEADYLPSVDRAAISRLIGGGRFIGWAESKGRREATGDHFKFNYIEHFHVDYPLYLM
jgi:hypothetical protein